MRHAWKIGFNEGGEAGLVVPRAEPEEGAMCGISRGKADEAGLGLGGVAWGFLGA